MSLQDFTPFCDASADNRQIIAFAAPKGSGKTLCANYLGEYISEHTNKTVIRLSFARALRRAVAATFDMNASTFMRVSSDPETKDEPLPELNGFTPRAALIAFGNAVREHVTPDHWSKVVENRIWKELQFDMFIGEEHDEVIEAPGDSEKVVIIDDVRFPNEAAMIQRMGGVVVGVIRPEAWPTGYSGEMSKTERAVRELVMEGVQDFSYFNVRDDTDVVKKHMAILWEAGRFRHLRTYDPVEMRWPLAHSMPGGASADTAFCQFGVATRNPSGHERGLVASLPPFSKTVKFWDESDKSVEDVLTTCICPVLPPI